MSPLDYIWLLFLLSSLQPLIQQRVLAIRRMQVLHTPGGLVLAAEQIAAALAAHEGPVTVHVPHYAMSGGTLIAPAATGSCSRPRPCSARSTRSWASTPPRRFWRR